MSDKRLPWPGRERLHLDLYHDHVDMQTLDQIAAAVKRCTLCPLSRLSHAVPGEGNPEAEIMFVGEGPGQREDETGLPFQGRAGEVLDEMISSANLKRNDVFITNVVKCRPPENRDPKDFEIETCSGHYLSLQAAIIKPKLIVTLGRHSMKWFLKQDLKISSVHGQLRVVKNSKTGEVQYILPLYHPVARSKGAHHTTKVADFAKIPAILQKIRRGEISLPPDESGQKTR
jgi:uracil-DNA glycosylase